MQGAVLLDSNIYCLRDFDGELASRASRGRRRNLHARVFMKTSLSSLRRGSERCRGAGSKIGFSRLLTNSEGTARAYPSHVEVPKWNNVSPFASERGRGRLG